ncbi:SRPBCC family protein [Arthrobacter bussei]|jgi:carbon monoxide dehydrogenase subunit G|uniref:SRPBCC family protein n=1 Tax=Arthrobacter bussei TaxID=2594179 RepID=A0A7X1NN06_9MICC|nr:SRPBCC family protein [Arthrobacter bussei]MPY09735.1 SRPBCC family protein [Arthrobacter bussei]
MSTKVEETVVVNLPVTTVYNQWTQFEEFPHFMGGVKQITQLGDDRMEWVAEIGGIRRQWEARVVEQVPDRKVSWAATEGATNAGTVSFEDLGGTTRINLVLEYEPEGLVEKVGDKLNVVENQAKKDLQNFKEFIESESYATGAWRGTVPGIGGTPTVEDADSSRGDSGKAGVSGKVAAGVGVAAAAAVAGVAAAAAGKKDDEDTTVEVTPVVDAAPVVPETTPVVPETTPIVADDDVVDVDPVPAVDGIPGTGVPSETGGLQDGTILDGNGTDRRGTL